MSVLRKPKNVEQFAAECSAIELGRNEDRAMFT